MELSAEQDAALKKASEWFRSARRGEASQVFRIFGPAGTGKTSLARYLAEEISGTTLFCAFTGKAAHVLTMAGCPAATIHSLIYVSRDRSRARLLGLERDLCDLRERGGDAALEASLLRAIQAERRALASPCFTLNSESDVKRAALAVVDEGGMIDARLGSDLLSFGIPVLVLGDPAQLPPIHGQGFFNTDSPDVLLTEIHRQARDNPILRLATMAREGRSPGLGSYGSSRVISRHDMTPDVALAADQILLGRNATRHKVNQRVRALLGRASELPEVGDRLVCLRNNHEVGLLNGGLWTAKGVEFLDPNVLLEIESEFEGQGDLCVEAHAFPFTQEEAPPYWTRKEAEEFAFGYGLTVHKAQGSQFREVVILDESHVFRGDRWKWLYTGITRAIESVCIVRGY